MKTTLVVHQGQSTAKTRKSIERQRLATLRRSIEQWQADTRKLIYVANVAWAQQLAGFYER
jgi:hypothetical protein